MKNQILSCLLSSRSCSIRTDVGRAEGWTGWGKRLFSVAERASVRLLGCLAWVRPLWRGILLINWLIGAAILACTGDT